ncbi:MAG: hypothetical protein GTN80_00965 [Nitrososphaeria archaeon]|nr:hypothetical protein [Nitrososphaeria archaeon]NIN51722.1 hypothetical protein [Nitrososphaeria archaeon]NIQ32216.1 hypothetical protein [Nitrososphaeria archaeon]
MVCWIRNPSPNVFKILSLVFLTLSFAIFIYFFLRASLGLDEFFPVGQNMVALEFPPPPFPVYAKPVTYFVFFFVLGWMFGTEAVKKRASRWPKSFRRLLFIISGFFAFLAGYEVLYNFVLWATLMSSVASHGKLEMSPDYLANTFPNPAMAWNLVFATKIFLMTLFVAFYSMYFLLSLGSEK